MSTTLTFRVSEELKEKLEMLAQSTRRSKSFLAAEALERFVEEESWQVAHIKEGIRQAEQGLVVSAEEMDAWLATWGTARKRPQPKVRKRIRA